jgi:hypothetical protein
MYNNQLKIIEPFLVNANNTTNIGSHDKIKKNFENNQKINRSMTVNSLTKIFNNVANDVIQKNSAAAAAAVGASNTIFISGIKCETVRISGNRQVSATELDLKVKTQQASTSKVSSDIVTNINKTIEKVGGTDLAALQAENTKQFNDYMRGANPGYDPTKAQKLASQCPGGGGALVSGDNTCNVKTSYELDGSIKNALELDDSFKITDDDDLSADIKNKIEQSNFASCQANASAQNSIIIQDIICTVNNAAVSADKASKRAGTFEFEDNEQIAVAKLFMTCVFDQKNVNEISTKIMNTIAKRYNQIYDAVAKKAETKGPEYYKKAADLVDLLAASGTEQIQAAAGNLPPRVPDKEIKTEIKSELPINNSTIDSFPESKPTSSIDSIIKDLAVEKTKQKQTEAEILKITTQQEKEQLEREAKVKKDAQDAQIKKDAEIAAQIKKDAEIAAQIKKDAEIAAQIKKDAEIAAQIKKEQIIAQEKEKEQEQATMNIWIGVGIGVSILFVVIIISLFIYFSKSNSDDKNNEEYNEDD